MDEAQSSVHRDEIIRCMSMSETDEDTRIAACRKVGELRLELSNEVCGKHEKSSKTGKCSPWHGSIDSEGACREAGSSASGACGAASWPASHGQKGRIEQTRQKEASGHEAPGLRVATQKNVAERGGLGALENWRRCARATFVQRRRRAMEHVSWM